MATALDRDRALDPAETTGGGARPTRPKLWRIRSRFQGRLAWQVHPARAPAEQSLPSDYGRRLAGRACRRLRLSRVGRPLDKAATVSALYDSAIVKPCAAWAALSQSSAFWQQDGAWRVPDVGLPKKSREISRRRG